jgi:hypothetical protein
MSEGAMKMSKRGKRIVLGVVAGVCLVLCLAFAIGVRWASRHPREFVVKSLQQQFHGDVRLDSIEMKMYPSVQISGAGLAIYLAGREDLPPVIAVKSFTAEANWSGLARWPHHVAHLTLVGLQITIPAGLPGEEDARARSASLARRFSGVYFDDVETENATLTVLPRDAGKQPEVLNIVTLRGRSISGDTHLAVQATLRNAVPPCDIVTDGTFGPWNPDLPALTPVSGAFSLNNADLSTVSKAVAGTLSAEGRYNGVIENISANGTTDAPDFSMQPAAHQVDLTTAFHVVVDGANGEMGVEALDVHFLHSTIHATGIVAGTLGQQGQAVKMELSATDARTEEILLLTNKGEPAMTGNIRLHTTLSLPAGPQNDPMNQMAAEGSFELDKVVFSDVTAEKRMNSLSARSSGQNGNAPAEIDVASEMQGKFAIQNGVMTFSDLRFQVPGARVRMIGTLGLENQNFDLRGRLDVDASLSKMGPARVSFLLKAVQPFFSKPGGGSRIFFKLDGTVAHPIYLLDLHPTDQEKTADQAPNNTDEARAN